VSVEPPSSRQRSEGAPASWQLSAAPAAGPEEPTAKILSEVRFGLMVHDIGPFSRNEEGGLNGNLELLFVSPDFLDIVWSPRPHAGFSINSEGNTSQVYAGLSWEWSFWGDFFAGFSLGGSVNNGKTEHTRLDRKELGCHLLFRESVEVGYRFGGRHAISGMLDHISNANICDKNEGIDTFGIRYGYSF
jgi:lipid A 3-O-deacylase